MFDVVFEFGDGTTFSPNLRHVFGPGTQSRVIDLPGGARKIDKVHFRYGNLPGGGRAQVEVWGLDARDDDRDGRDGAAVAGTAAAIADRAARAPTATGNLPLPIAVVRVRS
jgi:hypothetical protein